MKPKRKRAYHRALKRGEPWALVEKGMREILNRITADLYCPPQTLYAYCSNPGWNTVVTLKEEK